MKSLRESILTSIGQGDKYFDDLLKKYDLDPEKVTWNKDGSIDYRGNVSFVGEDIEEFPLKFNTVSGSFWCTDCKNLKSLKGAPKEVVYGFMCNGCDRLKTLEGAPERVGWGFSCRDCNGLESLKGCPDYTIDFNCSGCKNLKSLKYGPKEIKGNYFCYNCGKEFTEEEARKYTKVKGKIYVRKQW